ncbi:hypothetical protein [Pseudomarimonas arenosa]|uniref:DUF3408 domain-containing protein n=1 Tax=Pseudomarimonas arenosa TaxID=2774145 RepID=A0AAW3ZPS6_9GAMM|nr:hypothetical protein [Pseudomarimonas arenosa]MBD8527102.1 hypothetical protein [Pseudomarimonas arenosa]
MKKTATAKAPSKRSAAKKSRDFIPQTAPDPTDDGYVNLKVRRRLREQLRKVAAIEEVFIHELTERVILDFIDDYEHKSGIKLPQARLSNAASRR